MELNEPEKDYRDKKSKLLSERKDLQDKLVQIDKELELLRVQVKPFCSHPIKVDTRFNVCGICNDIINKT